MYGGGASIEVSVCQFRMVVSTMRLYFTYSSRMSKEVRSHGLNVALGCRGEFANCFEVFLC